MLFLTWRVAWLALQATGSDHQTFTIVLKDMTDELTMKAALEQERLESSKKSNLMSAVYSSTVDSIIIIDELGKVRERCLHSRKRGTSFNA